ncbi:hypothetical protein BV22DRAFT_1190578 [Leucogyrophana mollusca]|uniref:Uncharacterized protein n=1 Tax=Leucogyrophana mollusca TaxID=85980 RepID=A0ACB8C1X5_9AGAM|nr:hypothetical protein BV22DRAFT_1190578 [Leucogyrophana mollusca]
MTYPTFASVRTNPLHQGTAHASMHTNEATSFNTSFDHVGSSSGATTLEVGPFSSEMAHFTREGHVATPVLKRQKGQPSATHVQWSSPLFQVRTIPARGGSDGGPCDVEHFVKASGTQMPLTQGQSPVAMVDGDSLVNAIGILNLVSRDVGQKAGVTSQDLPLDARSHSAVATTGQNDGAAQADDQRPSRGQQLKREALLRTNLRHVRARFPQSPAPQPLAVPDATPTLITPHGDDQLHPNIDTAMQVDHDIGPPIESAARRHTDSTPCFVVRNENSTQLIEEVDNAATTAEKKRRPQAWCGKSEAAAEKRSPARPVTPLAEIGQNGVKRQADSLDDGFCDGTPRPPHQKRKTRHVLPDHSPPPPPVPHSLHDRNDHATVTRTSAGGAEKHAQPVQQPAVDEDEEDWDVIEIEDPTIDHLVTPTSRGKPLTARLQTPYPSYIPASTASSSRSPVSPTHTNSSHSFVHVNEQPPPIASSSRVRLEEQNVPEWEEGLDDDAQSLSQQIAAMEGKMRKWASSLEYIYGLRHAATDPATGKPKELIKAREVLGILKDVDEKKYWMTEAEVRQTHLAARVRGIIKTLRRESEEEAKIVATRVLDNFAQRFRRERYPRRQ